MEETMDFLKNERFLQAVKINWDALGWPGRNIYSSFVFTFIIYVRPEKKSPNQFMPYFAQFDFKNKTVSYMMGESTKISPPPIGVIYEADNQSWVDAFRTGIFKPIKHRVKLFPNSVDNMQATGAAADTGILPTFLRILYQTIFELDLIKGLKNYETPPDIPLTQEEWNEAKKGVLEAVENQVLTCPKCGTVSKGDIRQCPKCGAQLPVDVDKYANMFGESVGKILDRKTGIKCPKCDSINPNSNKFCTKCGSQFPTEGKNPNNETPLGNDEKRCANCGELSKVSFKFCMKCGTKFPN